MNKIQNFHHSQQMLIPQAWKASPKLKFIFLYNLNISTKLESFNIHPDVEAL